MKYNYYMYDGQLQDGVPIRTETYIYDNIKPDTSNLKFNDIEAVGEIFNRQSITGTMRLVGVDYDLIVNYLSQPPPRASSVVLIDIAQNGVEIGTVAFDAEQTINYDKREVIFKVELIDRYSAFFSRWDKRYNIAGAPLAATVPFYNLIYFKQTFIEEIDVSFSNQLVTGYYDAGSGNVKYDIPSNGSLFAANFDPADPYTNWSVKISNYTINGNPNCTTFQFDISGTATFYRYNRLGSYEGNTSVAPPTTPATAWVRVSDINLGGAWYPVFIDQPTYSLASNSPDSGTVPCNWLVDYTIYSNNTPIPSISVTYTGALNRVDEALKFLITSTDGRIQYDNTGTSSDSFYGFKAFTGENVGGSNKPFANFALMGLSNFVPDLSGGWPGIQKTNLQSRLYIVLKEVLEELKKWGFYWEIELRSNIPYFRLYYKDQIALLTNNPFLGNYYGKDYRVHTKNYTWEEAEYYRIVNNQTVGNLEFIGTDMYNRFVQSGKTKEVTSGEYFYDTEDISDNGPDNYDEDSISAIVLFCCNVSGANYNVRQSTGFLINQETNNGELAWTNVTENLLAEIPFANGHTNGSSITYPTDRLKKRRQLAPLKLPIKGFNDFDTTSELVINGEGAKIQSISIDWNTNEAELKLIL